MSANQNEKMDVRVDWYTRVCLTVISVLLTVLIVGLWSDRMPQVPAARAAQPFADTSAQRKEMLNLQRQTNKRLEELADLFRTGSAKVTVVEKSDDKNKAPVNVAPVKSN